jgi:hypothetical protein
MDEVMTNSITYLATSIEAVALRVRDAVGSDDAERVLDWAKNELERLGHEAGELAPMASESEAA